jgi:hypothetical protein
LQEMSKGLVELRITQQRKTTRSIVWYFVHGMIVLLMYQDRSGKSASGRRESESIGLVISFEILVEAKRCPE